MSLAKHRIFGKKIWPCMFLLLALLLRSHLRVRDVRDNQPYLIDDLGDGGERCSRLRAVASGEKTGHVGWW